MTLAAIISHVDQVRPNQYNNNQKTHWISEVEGMTIEEVFNMSEGNNIIFKNYTYEGDAEKELRIPDRFADIYMTYLMAKIDFYDNETENYNNDVMMYQSSLEQFAAWYRRKNRPKQTNGFTI